MNYYDARQDSDTKKWHYTCRNDREIYAVGHCTEDGGHETAAEARSCYRSFLIEAAKLSVKVESTGVCRVAGCRKQTKEIAQAQGFPYLLCDKHMNREGLEKVFPAVGSSVSS